MPMSARRWHRRTAGGRPPERTAPAPSPLGDHVAMGRRRKPAGRMGEGDGAGRARARGAITTVSLVGLCLGLALTTVPARAARVDGVSEQNLAHWDDAAFSVSSYSGGYFPSPFRPVLALASAPSRVTLARLVVPWDVMAHVRPE